MTNDDWRDMVAELEADHAKEVEALRDEIEKLQEKNEVLGQRLSGCPFDRPGYELPLDVPCPVCGTLGLHDSPNLCLYPNR